MKLRVGVVGVGPMGQGHVKHYRGLAGCELVGVVDPDPARRGETAARHGCMSFAEAKDLIGRVDAVSIATPTTTHLDLVLMFLQAGVHVLVEKPMAPSSQAAEQMVAAANRRPALRRRRPALAVLVPLAGHRRRPRPDDPRPRHHPRVPRRRRRVAQGHRHPRPLADRGHVRRGSGSAAARWPTSGRAASR